MIHHMILIIYYFIFIYDVLLLHLFRYMSLILLNLTCLYPSDLQSESI